MGENSFKNRKANLVPFEIPLDIQVDIWIDILKGAAIPVDIKH